MAPPLSVYSCHHPRVALWWPQGAARMVRRFSSEKYCASAFTDFLHRFHRFHNPLWRLNRIAEMCRVREYHPKRRVQNVSWLVLPWHPAWLQTDLSTAISRTCRRPEFMWTLGSRFGTVDHPFVRISWANHLPALAGVCRAMSRRLFKVGGWGR